VKSRIFYDQDGNIEKRTEVRKEIEEKKVSVIDAVFESPKKE